MAMGMRFNDPQIHSSQKCPMWKRIPFSFMPCFGRVHMRSSGPRVAILSTFDIARRSMRLYVVCSILCLLPAATFGQVSLPDWNLAFTQPAVARLSMNVAFDSGRQVTVMFGGRDESLTTVFSDTYEYALAAWRKVLTPHSPPARFWAGMAYDDQRSRMVLFGGLASSSTPALLNDTWEYDGHDWTGISTVHSPVAQSGLSMTYDSCRQKTVVFDTQGDTWEYNGVDWTEVTTSTVPPVRNLAALVFDPGRCRSILFGGGQASLIGLSDTWEYDGANWTQISTATSPPGRWGHVMAFDTNRARAVLFGGYGPSYPTGQETNDTWEYDGSAWVRGFPAQSPLPAEQRAMAYDSTRARVVMFGGFGDPGEAWEYIGLNPNCSYSLNPSSQSFPTSGGFGSFTVNTGPTCAWTPVPDSGWFTILPSGYKGTAKVNYAVAANSGAARTGTIFAGGQQFTINQAALSCTYTITPELAVFDYTGGKARVVVTAPAGCSWNATSNVGWMTLSATGGTGTSAVVVTAANAFSQRIGTAIIAGQIFTGLQNGVPPGGGGGGGGGANACGAVDVTSRVRVSQGGMQPIGTNLFYQQVTITNSSGSAIKGPLNYVLIGLPSSSGAGLTTGPVTYCFSSAGSSIVTVSGGLANGQHVTFGMDFVRPPGTSLNYSPRVLSGQPSK